MSLPDEKSTNDANGQTPGSGALQCPHCGSTSCKKRFFAGSKTLAIVCFVIAGGLLLELNDQSLRGKADWTALLGVGLFVFAGVMGLVSKKYRCLNCKKVFGDPKAG